MKKLSKAYYVFAGLLMVYAIWLMWSSGSEVLNYYKGYEVDAPVKEVLLYVLQAGIQPIVYALSLAALGILIGGKELPQKENSTTPDYESMKKSDLYELAKSKELKVTTKMTKAEIIDILKG